MLERTFLSRLPIFEMQIFFVAILLSSLQNVTGQEAAAQKGLL